MSATVQARDTSLDIGAAVVEVLGLSKQINMNAEGAKDQPATRLDGASNANVPWTASMVEGLQFVYKMGQLNKEEGKRVYFDRNKETDVWRARVCRDDGRPDEVLYSLGVCPEPKWKGADLIAKDLELLRRA